MSTDKELLKKLQESEEKFRNFMDSATDNFFLLDSKLNVIDINKAALNSIGLSKQEIIGKNIVDFSPDVKESGRCDEYMGVIRTSKPLTLEDVVSHPKYGKKHYRVKAFKVGDGLGTISTDITERKKAEEVLRQKTQDIAERVKELTCLYGVSRLLEDPRKPLEEVVYQVLVLVPPAWQHPEVTCAGITYDGKKITTDNFQETFQGQSADIMVSGKAVGTVEVYYREEMPEIFEGPFLKEERELIDALARELAKFIVRKQAEEALQRQKDWLEVTFSSVGDAVIVTDTDAKINLINPMAEKLTGWTAQEALGQQISKVFWIINEQTRQTVDNPVDRVLKEGGIVGLANHTVLIARDGREIPIDDSGAPIRTSDGTTLGAVLVFRDIIERKKAEEEVRKSEEKFRLMVSEVKDYAILMLDPKGIVSSWNDGAQYIKGYRDEEIIGQHFSCFYPKEAIEARKPDEELKIASDQGRFEEEGWRVRKDGSQFLANVVITALRDETGTLIGFSKVTRDISKHKEAEDKLKKHRDNLERLNEKLHRQSNVTEAINKVLQETMTCEMLEEVGKICLSTGEELTNSKFGFIGLINEAGLYDTIAISDPGYASCKLPGSEKIKLITNMTLDGIDRSTMREGKSRIVNDPTNHPDKKGIPKGHPPITAFLGVPFMRWGETIGMIGLANKDGGYDGADQKSIEALSVAFLEVLNRMQKEKEDSNKINLMVEELKKHKDQLEKLVQERTTQLKETQERLEKFLDAAPDAFVIFDSELNYLEINEVGLRMGGLGLKKEDIIRHNIAEFIPDLTESGRYDQYMEVIRTGKPLYIDDLVMHPKFGNLHLTVRAFKVGDGMGYIVQNITERKKMEDSLRESEERLSRFMESATDAFVILDSQMRFLEINRTALEMWPKGTTKESIIGKSLPELVPGVEKGDRYPKYLEVIRTGKPFFVEEQKADPMFGDRHFTVKGFKVGDGIGVVTTDITEEVRLQEELVLKERLAVLGQLAGGVGHELRNPLGAIKNAAFFLNMTLEESESEVKESLEIIDEEVGTSERIISSLLDFARPKTPQQA